MRLTELEPELRSYLPGGYLGHPATLAEAQGIWFLCPRCFVKNGGPIGTHEVLVWFADRGVPAEAEPSPRWTVSGTSFDDISLDPSIDCTKDKQGNVAHPEEWHGYLKNGEIT
ncbi:MAG TPA: DUF6527 family protein [Gammaproteobacteria bacterium]|jgi:hypothetical protein